MASYNSILRHVSMADVKRNTWKLQEQKRIDEQRRQEELDLRKYNNSPLYSDWRFDLDEAMTTQAMTYATTLPAEGDTVLTDVPAQSGDMGTVEGLEADGEIKFGTIEPNESIFGDDWNQTAVTKSYDTRLLSTLSFTLAVGTGADAPQDIHPLKVYYTSATGATGQLSGNLLSSGTYNFELPAAAQSSATTFKFEVKDDNTYNNGSYFSQYQRRYAVGRTFRGGIVQDNLADDGYGPYQTSRSIWDIINNDYHNNGLTDDQKSDSMGVFEWGGIIGMDPSPESGDASGFPSFRSERIAYYDLMRSTFADLLGKTSRTFTVSDIGLKRRTPITVFVALDSPKASAFVRTGEFGELTSDEKKKKLQDMLNAGDAYLLNKFGDPFPGTGGDYSFTDVNLPPSWEQAAGEEPGLMMKGLQKQTGGKMAPMPMMKQPTGGNMPTPSGYDLLDQDPKRTTLAQLSPKTEKEIDAMLLKGLERGDYGSGPQIQKQIDSLKRNMRQGTPGGIPKAQKKNKQPVVAHYEPEGEMIVEKKLKKPQEFFKDKDIKPEFPENPPPPQIKGLHPDLVTGEKTAQRFNRLDPISARAMPRTGIKAIDKKVKIASKKPK